MHEPILHSRCESVRAQAAQLRRPLSVHFHHNPLNSSLSRTSSRAVIIIMCISSGKSPSSPGRARSPGGAGRDGGGGALRPRASR